MDLSLSCAGAGAGPSYHRDPQRELSLRHRLMTQSGEPRT